MGVIRLIRDTRMLPPVLVGNDLRDICFFCEQLVGISTEGKSAKDLSTLIKEAAKKPPAPPPNTPVPYRSTSRRAASRTAPSA
jgi:hypothetical protein